MASEKMDKFIKSRTTHHNLQKFTPSLNLQHNQRSAGKMIPEEIAKRKFINKIKLSARKINWETKLHSEARMSEISRVKLRKIDVSDTIDRKYGLADENLQTEGGVNKENFKEKQQIGRRCKAIILDSLFT